jgi:hypothetical protein
LVYKEIRNPNFLISRTFNYAQLNDCFPRLPVPILRKHPSIANSREMGSDSAEGGVIPTSYAERNQSQGPLILPFKFTEFDQQQVFKDATTACDAAGAYWKDLETAQGDAKAILADAAAFCFTKAAELAAPPEGLALDEAQALLISFEDQRGRAPCSGRISIEALDSAIRNARDTSDDVGSMGLFLLGWQLLVRYIVNGRNEDFDEAVAIWTRQAKHFEDSDEEDMLSQVRNHIATAYLQRCTRWERTDEAVERSMESAQIAAGNDEDEAEVDALLLLAIAYEQRFYHHGDKNDMAKAIELVKSCIFEDPDVEDEESIRVQYEFGRLTASFALACQDSNMAHEGIYNVQRATEKTTNGSPLWHFRQEVLQDFLEAYKPEEAAQGLNALIRARRAQVLASAALKRPDHEQLLVTLADLLKRRFMIRKTKDDLLESQALMEQAGKVA